MPIPTTSYFHKGIPVPRVLCHGRTELTEVPGTGNTREIRAGPAMQKLNVDFRLNFWTRCNSCTINIDALSFGPLFLFFLPRDMTHPTIQKNTKAIKTCQKKQNRPIVGPTLNPFERAAQRRVKKFRSKLAKLSGASL